MSDQMFRQLIRDRQSQGVDPESITAELAEMGVPADRARKLFYEIAQSEEAAPGAPSLQGHLDLLPIYVVGLVGVVVLVLFLVLPRERVAQIFFVGGALLFGVPLSINHKYRWMLTQEKQVGLYVLASVGVALVICGGMLAPDMIQHWIPRRRH